MHQSQISDSDTLPDGNPNPLEKNLSFGAGNLKAKPVSAILILRRYYLYCHRSEVDATFAAATGQVAGSHDKRR
jgi:hypothetical protein